MKITLLLYMLISGIFFFSCQSSSQEKNIQEEMHFYLRKVIVVGNMGMKKVQ